MSYYLNNLSCACALGATNEQVYENALKGSQEGMVFLESDVPNKRIRFGMVPCELPPVKEGLDLRVNRLLVHAVSSLQGDIDRIVKKYGTKRIAIILGASNTGIDEAQRQVDEWIEKNEKPESLDFSSISIGNVSEFLKNHLGIEGPSFVISTACSSATKAFASAKRFIESGVVDAAIVGGVDGRCRFAMNGFNALESLAKDMTKPLSAFRDGINLGEGVALFIMEKEPLDSSSIILAGVGESSDAYHMTSPHPDGAGAEVAMRAALADAQMDASDIDHVNLHGTGTIANDSMELKAVSRLFGSNVVCSSTKQLTGHCLGVAGAIEAALGWLMLKNGGIIPHVGDEIDPELPQVLLAREDRTKRIKTFLSNSFAFGGSNATLILKTV